VMQCHTHDGGSRLRATKRTDAAAPPHHRSSRPPT
jgi:hypothetical protein